MDSARRIAQGVRYEPPAQPHRPLTERQEAVAKLLAYGKSYDEIAVELYMARATVQYHVSAIALLLPSDELEARDRVLVWAYWTYRKSAA